MSVFAAVPVKDLVNAKQRLIPVLSGDERSELARSMLEDVLDALAVARFEAVHVVTRDAAVIELARRRGVGCLTERANRGHTEAVAFAQREALAAGAVRFITVPGDAPCTTADELVQLAEALGGGPGVAFVPSLSGFGTNGVLLSPPDAMSLKFGEPSFGNHLEAARDRGWRPRVLNLPGLGLDIDAPEDLGALLERGSHTRSAALLRRLDVATRLPSA